MPMMVSNLDDRIFRIVSSSLGDLTFAEIKKALGDDRPSDKTIVARLRSLIKHRLGR